MSMVGFTYRSRHVNAPNFRSFTNYLNLFFVAQWTTTVVANTRQQTIAKDSMTKHFLFANVKYRVVAMYVRRLIATVL